MLLLILCSPDHTQLLEPVCRDEILANRHWDDASLVVRIDHDHAGKPFPQQPAVLDDERDPALRALRIGSLHVDVGEHDASAEARLFCARRGRRCERGLEGGGEAERALFDV